MTDFAMASWGRAIGVPISILVILIRPTAVPQKPIKARTTAMCMKTFVNRWERAKIPQMRTNIPKSVGIRAKMLIIPVVK